MKRISASTRTVLLLAVLSSAPLSHGHTAEVPRTVLPDAVVDLRTTAGAARVQAKWRYSDTHIAEIDHRSVGLDLKASGPKNRTFDFTPDARAADFDDSMWAVIAADSLEKRRGNGRLSMNWYRLDITIPENVGGFTFTEGPLWVNADSGGYLLFSDPNNNLIYRLSADGDVQPYLTKSGYAGENMGEYGQPGSNGLTLDEQGRLTICQHGNRRVVRIEQNGLTTVLADRIDGQRLNSPNDLVYRSDGTLFFTDPPFGLPKHHADSRRETPHLGVYSVRDGQVRLVAKDFTGPNGLAFSPDEKFLYVGNWDDTNKVVFRYPVNTDGTLGTGELFVDMTRAPGTDAIDGIKVDQRGNVYVSGPGGLWILDARGRHLGTLRCPEHPHNMAWGGTDGLTLYLAAQTGIYSLRLNVAGAGALPKPATMAKN